MELQNQSIDALRGQLRNWEPLGIVLVAFIVVLLASMLVFKSIMRYKHRRKKSVLPRAYILPVYTRTSLAYLSPTDLHEDTTPAPAYEVHDPHPRPGVTTVCPPTTTQSRRRSGLRDGYGRDSPIFGSVQRQGIESAPRRGHLGCGSVGTFPTYEAHASN